MATKDPVRAASEMSEVRRLAGESLIEVQVAVDGYRSLDLDKELAGARAALEAAGATCTIDARAEDLSPPARILLAWAIREGATNVLKHSRATWCSITIDGGVLEMRNDGVHAPDGGTGSGLRGLAERMSTAGGSFSASPTRTGEFLLRARVPA
jgi:two-component system sensor histidine kinase DesK